MFKLKDGEVLQTVTTEVESQVTSAQLLKLAEIKEERIKTLTEEVKQAKADAKEVAKLEKENK